MGIEQTVLLPSGATPVWPAIRDLLAGRGLTLQMRMIDGALAFPEEQPADNWRELRLATQQGMAITVKRQADQVRLIVWGNADPSLIEARNALAWAFAETGNGCIGTIEGSETPAQFWNRSDMPAGFKDHSAQAWRKPPNCLSPPW